MNLPTLIVIVLIAAALFLVIRFYVRSGRKITDCGCGRGSRCSGCNGCNRSGQIDGVA